MSLLKMFWRAALPSSDSPAQYLQKVSSFCFPQYVSILLFTSQHQRTKTVDTVHIRVYVQEQLMKEEIESLRMRIAEQEEVLQNTIQRLRSTSRTKESMETFIVSQRQSQLHNSILRNITDDSATETSVLVSQYFKIIYGIQDQSKCCYGYNLHITFFFH